MVAGPFQPDVVWVEDLQACRRAISKARNAAGRETAALREFQNLPPSETMINLPPSETMIQNQIFKFCGTPAPTTLYETDAGSKKQAGSL